MREKSSKPKRMNRFSISLLVIQPLPFSSISAKIDLICESVSLSEDFHSTQLLSISIKNMFHGSDVADLPRKEAVCFKIPRSR
jgi:hypothetical protein